MLNGMVSIKEPCRFIFEEDDENVARVDCEN